MLLTLFDNINFPITLLLKLGQIFEEVAKLGKSTQDAGKMANFVSPWVAEGIAFDVNDFNVHFRAQTLTFFRRELLS